MTDTTPAMQAQIDAINVMTALFAATPSLTVIAEQTARLIANAPAGSVITVVVMTPDGVCDLHSSHTHTLTAQALDGAVGIVHRDRARKTGHWHANVGGMVH